MNREIIPIGDDQKIQYTPLTTKEEDFERCDRLTCQMGLVYENCNTEPHGLRLSFSELVNKSKEQRFVRELELGYFEWIPLPLGWLADKPLSMLVIENRTGRNLKLNPTEEERALMARQYVLLSTDKDIGNAIKIPTGRFQPLDLVVPRRWYMKASEGKIPITVSAYPG